MTGGEYHTSENCKDRKPGHCKNATALNPMGGSMQVQHIVSACPKLAGTKYTKQHNDVAHFLHWNLLKERGIEVPVQSWKHVPIASVINGDTTINWDLKIITNKSLEHNRPDIVLCNIKEGWEK
eukprot:6938655-Ditylum_brightwellii.AAC.1